MITAIEIENFKGIRDRVRIELKPITLLFGPNSAGKSTILHALHYAREILERRNLDADQTVVGGKFIDLGGFRNLVHGHDISRPVVLRFDLDLTGKFLFSHLETLDRVSEHVAGFVDSLFRTFRSAAITVEIAHSDVVDAPYVRRYAIEINGRAFAEICHNPSRRTTELTMLDTEHPVLIRPRDFAVEDTEEQFSILEEVHGDIDRSILDICMKHLRGMLPYTGGAALLIDRMDDALPIFARRFRLITKDPSLDDKENLPSIKDEAMFDEVMIELHQMIVGPTQILLRALQSARYLGPLRETPPRNFTPARYPDPSRWANGFAAWDMLYTDPEIGKLANAWLSGVDSLDVGYTIKVQNYLELAVDHPLLVLLRSGRGFEDLDNIEALLNKLPARTTVTLVADDTNIEVAPHDVGVGISQLIPVVVLAVDPGGSVDAIEQPELHVHPAIQVRLGDLFIQQITAHPARRFLLETHSEHLLLRLLRRIRETTDGDLPPGQTGLKPDQVSVIYVEPAGGDAELGQSGRPLTIRSLRIDETGEFLDQWPRGFFEERAEELF